MTSPRLTRALFKTCTADVGEIGIQRIMYPWGAIALCCEWTQIQVMSSAAHATAHVDFGLVKAR